MPAQSEDEVKKLVTIMQNPLQYKVPKWFLNRQKDVKDGKWSQCVANGLDNKLRGASADPALPFTRWARLFPFLGHLLSSYLPPIGGITTHTEAMICLLENYDSQGCDGVTWFRDGCCGRVCGCDGGCEKVVLLLLL